jgi:hypothetical protein
MRFVVFLSCYLLILSILSSTVLCDGFKANKHINDCVKHCIKERGHTKHYCSLHCESGYTDTRTLSIYDEGILVSPSIDGELADDDKQTLNLPKVRFDKALFNTPSAFDELIKMTDVLKQQIAVEAEKVFQTNDGTQFHFLSMVCLCINSTLINSIIAYSIV